MATPPDRATVSTYVPEEQRDVWAEEAASMEMSLSEFVRSMVQAGRRGFSLAPGDADPVEGQPVDANPGGNDRKTAVLDLLGDRGPMTWNDLLESMAGDLEEGLDAALRDLQREGRIEHSPRRGEYELAGESHGE